MGRTLKFAGKALWSVIQIGTGALMFYSGAFVLAWFVQNDRGGIPIVLFTLLAPACFAFLTMVWYEFCTRKMSMPRPELNLIIGSAIFMPVYFEVASLLIFKPRPIVVRDILSDLFWYYITFPITLSLLGLHTATLFGLVLSIVSTVVTGRFVRKRMALT
ncbi:MAG: hypothetical protein ACRENT_06270 [Thermodesulfobacteriota bacterium]